MDPPVSESDERQPLLPPPSAPESPKSDRSSLQRSGTFFVSSGTVAAPLVCSGGGASEEKGVSSETNRRKVVVALPLVVITYFLGYIASMVIVNPFVYDRVAQEYDYKVNTSSQMPCVKDMNNATGNASAREVQEEIERRVSTIELYLHLATFMTAVLPILLLGPITDKFGRKAGFLLPITGTLLKQLVYIVVVSLQLPLSFLYLAHFIEAMGGSFAAMLSSMFAVTSDMTRSGHRRSGWIAVMEALQTLSASLGQVLVAQGMKRGYIYPLVSALCMCCLSLLLVTFFLPETNPPSEDEVEHADRQTDRQTDIQTGRQAGRRCLAWFNTAWKTIWYNVRLYTSRMTVESPSSSPTSVLNKRRLCMAIFILTIAVNFSSSGVTGLYQMKYPLCWTASKVYTFNGLRIFLSWVAILLIIALLQGFFNMAARYIAIVGVISAILSNAALSMAVNDVMVYQAAVVSVMVRSIVPMLRSVMSSLVNLSDQGSMYAGLGCIESLGAGVFSTIANRIYYATLSTWAGEIFMIFACVMFVALILLIILNVLFARESSKDRLPGNIQEVEKP